MIVVMASTRVELFALWQDFGAGAIACDGVAARLASQKLVLDAFGQLIDARLRDMPKKSSCCFKFKHSPL